MFRDRGIESADVDARVLVCAACGIDHATLVRDPDVTLGPSVGLVLRWTARRLDREPVSRILGRREFWGLSLAIAPSVLDPRPETEGLVGAVIDAIGGRSGAALRILDLGTGSGAVLCALLHELPAAEGIGVDRSIDACRIARSNLASLGLANRASVVCGSWDDALRVRFDIVVSNPPYIPHGDLAGLDRDVRDHDPMMALDGGPDGLDPYRAMAPKLGSLLQSNGIAAFECGWNQGESVAAILRGGLDSVLAYRDLAGHDRIVLGHRR